MMNLTQNGARERLKDSLANNPLYLMLRSVCPTFERRLQTVRPTTEDVMQQAVNIFDQLICNDQAATYCRGLWDELYCQWRDTTEKASRTPNDEDLCQTVAVVLYVVRTMLVLMDEPPLMTLACIIETEADTNCREAWQNAEKAFQPRISIALRDGLANWIKEYADSEYCLFDNCGMVAGTEAATKHDEKRFTANQYVVFAIYLLQKAGLDINHNLSKADIARFLESCTDLKEDTFTQKLKSLDYDNKRTKADMCIVADFLEDWLPGVAEQIRRDMDS